MACDLNLPASDDKTRACRCAFSCSLFRMRFRQCPSHTSPQSRRSNGSRWTQSFQSGKKKQDWFEPVSWVLQDNTVGIWNTTIWTLCFLQVRFKLVWFSNGQALAMAIATVPTIWKPDLSKPRHICPDFKWFLTKWRPFVWISNGCVSHSKSRPFANQPFFDHLESRQVQISDPHCTHIDKVPYFLDLKNPF